MIKYDFLTPAPPSQCCHIASQNGANIIGRVAQLVAHLFSINVEHLVYRRSRVQFPARPFFFASITIIPWDAVGWSGADMPAGALECMWWEIFVISSNDWVDSQIEVPPTLDTPGYQQLETVVVCLYASGGHLDTDPG